MSFLALSITALSIIQHASSLVIPRQSTGGSGDFVVASYYAGWHATEGFPLSEISWDKYFTLSRNTPTPSVDMLSLNGSDAALLPEFICQAHDHVSFPEIAYAWTQNVAAHLAIGGWGGSQYFSSNVATKETRTAFAKTVADFVDEYNIDGLNLDWEYPSSKGVGCNIISPNVYEVRARVGPGITLSIATPLLPFHDASGNPSKNVTGFAEVLDYITIMNYDVWGSWSSSVGPNAPLNDTCASPANQMGSAVSGVKAWNDAGMPLHKIVLNVAAYGHSFSVQPSDAFMSGSATELAPYPKFNASNQPLGDAWDNTSSVDTCGVVEKQGGTYRLWGLVSDGFLTTEGNPTPGIYYRYDECSQTPYVYNKTSEVMISFDNAQSFAAKGKYIKETGLRGLAMWETGGDYHNILLDSIRAAVGNSN